MNASPDSTATQPGLGGRRALPDRVQNLAEGRLRSAGILIPFVLLFIVLTV